MATPPKKVRGQPASTNDNREISNLEQYILSQNLDKVNRYSLSNKQLFNYATFRQVQGKGTQIINKLRGIENLNVFYKIKNSVLSLMQPKIRVYKVFHTDYSLKPDGTVDEKTLRHLQKPCYKEIKFSDNFGQETAATVADYLAYESTKPSYRNVGLKSFTITHNGANHGIIENNINCSLQLSFKSLKDIKAFSPGEDNVRYVDMILYPPARFNKDTEIVNPQHYEIKVLVGYTAPTPDQLRNLNISEEDVRNIAELEKLNLIFSLTLYDYKLDIKEDGQVMMTGNYRGRLETTIGTNQVNIFQETYLINKGENFSRKTITSVDSKRSLAHVYELKAKTVAMYKELKSPKCKDEKCKSREALISLIEKDAFFGEMYKKAEGAGLKGGTEIKVADKDKVYEWYKEADNPDKILNLMNQKIGAYKKEIYKSFMGQLIDGNEGGPGTRLFCYNASARTVSSLVTGTKEFAKIEKGLTAEQIAAAAIGRPNDSVGRCKNMVKDPSTLKSEFANDLTRDFKTEAQSKDKNKDKKPEKKDPAKKSTLNWDSNYYPFYFVYLGDIVELACKNAGFSKLDIGNPEDPLIFNHNSWVEDKKTGTNYPLKNARILLGPIEYVDAKGDIKTINLAQFPISFNLFRAWFMKYIVKRRAVQMPLGSFLGLLLKNLVLPSMGVGMPKSIKAKNTRSSVVGLSLPGKQKSGTQTSGPCGFNVDTEELLPMERILDVNSATFRQRYIEKLGAVSSESLIKTSYDYVLLYVTTSKDLKERKGDPAQDVKDGIYHFNIGSDMGLLKRMNFKRTQLNFLAELRSEQAEEDGVDQLEQLKFPHDTDVTLIGTSLFMPGMFYYVNPGLAGLGSPEDASSLAYSLNLGGYHLISEVRSTISPGRFETTVIGTQVV